MSVRMALAKRCACTCGGAIIGGGAVHVAENPPQRPSFVKRAKAATMVKQAPRRYARVKPIKRHRRVRTACVVKTPGTTTTTRTITYPGAMPMPLPPLPPMAGSTGGGVTVIGGSGGFGGGFGGGFFSGGFFGGSSGNAIFTASTSTSTGGSGGSSTSTSGGSTSTGGSSTSTGGSSTSTSGG